MSSLRACVVTSRSPSAVALRPLRALPSCDAVLLDEAWPFSLCCCCFRSAISAFASASSARAALRSRLANFLRFAALCPLVDDDVDVGFEVDDEEEEEAQGGLVSSLGTSFEQLDSAERLGRLGGLVSSLESLASSMMALHTSHK